MIKKQELRYGNWIFDPNKEVLHGNGYCQVENTGKDVCHYMYNHLHPGNKYENIYPIRLTTEILDKITHFRPYDKEGTKGYFNGDNIIIREADWSLFLHDESNGNIHWCMFLRSVHHLQNLYYDIEGHELDIKL